MAIPFTAPQSQIYDIGGSQSLKALFGITRFLDVGPSASFVFLPAAAPLAESGVAWGLGGGLRLKRPHDAVRLHGISPWADADLLYVRTGDLNRVGFDAAVGLSIPIGQTRTYWIGPFARYFQTLQPDRAGYDNRDAKILSVGISFEVGSGIRRKRAPEQVRVVPEQVRFVTRDVIRERSSCPDRDGDGIPDSIDRCPTEAGGIDNGGCPGKPKGDVPKGKLVLKEKLYFAWDRAKLTEASLPMLDEIVQTLKDNPGFRVQIDGHADSSGGDDYNQALSERRAEAALDYLVAHGISRDRLIAKGFSSSQPTDTNNTVNGRENNRRVDFVVKLIIVDGGGAK